MASIAVPLTYLIIRREGTTWYFNPGKRVIYNPSSIPASLNLDDRLQRYGLTKSAIAVELFRLNGGKPGYYLTNLKDKKYYYCGSTWEDVAPTLRGLGVGRADPM